MVAAAWVPPAAAGASDLTGQPGPQRRPGQPHRRADQRPRVLARLKGQRKAEQIATPPAPHDLGSDRHQLSRKRRREVRRPGVQLLGQVGGNTSSPARGRVAGDQLVEQAAGGLDDGRVKQRTGATTSTLPGPALFSTARGRAR
jgi:hypothetical protein